MLFGKFKNLKMGDNVKIINSAKKIVEGEIVWISGVSNLIEVKDKQGLEHPIFGSEASEVIVS